MPLRGNGAKGSERLGAQPLYYSDERLDGGFDDPDETAPETVFATCKEELERCRLAAAPIPLDRVVGEYSVRWIYLHVIEEYARHNGHADLLRERIDGKTGD
jgi:Protein of unknown function (DUF664)